MNSRSLIVVGASGHAKVVREALGERGNFVTATFDNRDVEPPFSDVPLYSGEHALDTWLAQLKDPTQVGFIVAIGGDRGRERLALDRRLRLGGLVPERVVHARAFVSQGAQLNDSSQILAMAAICEGALVGAQTIVNTAATVDHEAVLGAGVHIAPGARLAGLVRVDDYAFVGAGAVVLPRVHIGEAAIVGAGAVVLEDVPAGVTVVGNPARSIGVHSD